MDEQARYEEARKRVHEIRDFYQHLLVFICVNLALITINLMTSPGYYWFVWALVGWGIGLVMHGITVFGGLWGKDWEERKIRQLLEKQDR